MSLRERKCNVCNIALTVDNTYPSARIRLCKTHYKEMMSRHRKDVDNNYKDQKKYYKTEKGKEAAKKATKKMVIKYPEKWKARSIARYAVKIGTLIKGKCIVCGEDKVEAHHEDYSNPLKVVWFCNKHHVEHHKTAPL
jgi:hypothetical protein